MRESPQYQFSFSVIMAVYNVEEYLQESIDSLVSQDFGFEKIQLILVDDGSTDRSSAICDEYGARYPKNVIVIHKANGGVASARNEGIKYATGRFLNFMDSDDKMSKDAFHKVYQFFCTHEEETDIVTIPIELFDGASGPHWQNWKFEKGSRIIDLNTETETTVMFVTASFFAYRVKDQIEFDPRLVVAEDMKVLLSVLAEKMTLGVVADCVFYYRKRKQDENSLIQTAKRKRGWYFEYFDYFFDWAVRFYYERFGFIPAVIQYELMFDLQWRICEKYDLEMKEVLSKKEQEQYKERLFNAIISLEDEIIVCQKFLKEHQKSFLLQKKYGMGPHNSRTDDDVNLSFNEIEMEPMSNQTVQLDFIKLDNSDVTIEGSIKTFGIEWGEGPPEVFLTAGENQKTECKCFWREMDNQLCLGETTQKSLAFNGRISIETRTLPLTIGIEVHLYPAVIRMKHIEYGEFAPIGKYNSSYYCGKDLVLQPAQNGIQISKRGSNLVRREIQFLNDLWRHHQEGTRKAVIARLMYRGVKWTKRKEIWLISDRIMRAGDNGESFFRFLGEQHEGEANYYFLVHPESPDYNRLKQYGRVVPMMSFKHKLLYLLCDFNISSHADPANANPFHGHIEGYRDILADKRFVFLQHGIIKDDLSEWLARPRMNLYGFITSSRPEHQSILQYDYEYTEEEVWLTGLPRFDYISADRDKAKLITIAPTWRLYLMPTWNCQTGEKHLIKDVEKSTCVLFYNALLNNERLLGAAEQHGYQIAFFPHPNWQDHLEVFQQNEKVQFFGKEKKYEDIYQESSLMVTDYSSAIFDFVYMGKPVIYAQFDKDEFFAGEHVYQKGYFDYERDGLGEVEYDLESTVDRIIEYMENGCQMKEEYRKRADQFFAFHDQRNCERVYDRMMQQRQKE